MGMNKLPLPNLPLCSDPSGTYQRQLSVKLNEILGSYQKTINRLITRPDLPVYANNASAIAGGLVAGDFYRTGADPDVVCIVH